MVCPSKRLAPLKRTLSRYHTRFGMSTEKMPIAEREAKAASPPPFFSSIPLLQAKRKILSILSKTPHAPSSPCERKPKAHPCAKGDIRRGSSDTNPCAANENAHTTLATFHTTSPCPRRPCLAAPGPRAHRPPEAASPSTRLRLPAFPAPPLHPALACFSLRPRRVRRPPASAPPPTLSLLSPHPEADAPSFSLW